MTKQNYQKEVDYFYKSIKSNRGAIVAKQDVDADHKTLKQITEEAPIELDTSKVNEIKDYLIDNGYIKFVDSSTAYMLVGITPEEIKEDLGKKFVK